MQVRLARPDDRRAVIAAVAAAFGDDPAFGAFFGDAYPDLIGNFAGYLFDKRVGHQTAWVGHDGDVVALWDGPASMSQPDTSGARLVLPADAQARLDDYDARVHDALPSEPHWYLGILACHPDRRGGGLGRVVGRAGLDAAAVDGLPAFLETTNPDNVRVYESAGWQVHRELRDVLGLTVWVMRQDPPTSG